MEPAAIEERLAHRTRGELAPGYPHETFPFAVVEPVTHQLSVPPQGAEHPGCLRPDGDNLRSADARNIHVLGKGAPWAVAGDKILTREKHGVSLAVRSDILHVDVLHIAFDDASLAQGKCIDPQRSGYP